MKMLSKVAVCMMLLALNACAAEEKLPDGQLVDLAAGAETISLSLEVKNSSGKDERRSFVVKADGEEIGGQLTSDKKYEVRLTKDKRGIIFNHPDAAHRIVLVRTRLTGEETPSWLTVTVSKKADPKSGKLEYKLLKDEDNKELTNTLMAVIP